MAALSAADIPSGRSTFEISDILSVYSDRVEHSARRFRADLPLV